VLPTAVSSCRFCSFPNSVHFFGGATAPHWAMAYSCLRFLDHTQRRTVVGRTPLDEWSACRRDLYLTTRNTRYRRLCPRWDSNPQLNRRTAAEIRFRPRGHGTFEIVCITIFNLAYSCLRSLDHTQRRPAVGRTPLDEWSACRRDLYLTTRNTRYRHPCPRWDSNAQLSRRTAAEIRLRPRGRGTGE